MAPLRAIVLTGLVAALAGCGGGGGGDSSPTSAPPPVSGGTPAPTPSPSPSPAPAPPSGVAAAPDTFVSAFKISRFGQGAIVDAAGNTVCDEANCLQTVTPGQAFTLSPRAPAGWAFHHWVGCDQVVAETCQVTVSKDHTVHPYFARTTPIRLKPGVEILDQYNANALLKREGSMFIFTGNAWRPPQLPVGRIIVSTVGEGFARRVLSVTALPGGNTYVDTADVSLEDVIAEGTILYTAADVQAARLPGDERKHALGTATVDVNVLNANGSGIVGTLQVIFDTEFALDVSLTEGVREFKLIFTPEVKPQVELRLSAPVAEWERPMVSRVFPPIVVGPVVMIPKLDAKLTFEAAVSDSVTLGGFYTGKGTVGRHYVKGFGTQDVGEYSSSAKFDVKGSLGLQAKVEATLGVEAEGSVKIWGVAGPFVAAVGEVTAAVVDDVSADAACPFRITTEWSAGLDAGGRAEILGAKVEFLQKLRPLGGKVFDDIDPLRCDDTKAPTQPTGLVAFAESPTTVRLAWNPSTDNSKSVTYSVRRLIPTIAQTKDTNYADLGLRPDTEYCYVVVAVDKKGNRSEPSNTACDRTPESTEGSDYVPSNPQATPLSATAIRLAWPLDPANKAKSYVVYQDGIEVGRSTGSSFDALKLERGRQYCFRVSSLTEGGQSPLSVQVCATTLDAYAWSMSIKCDVQSTYVVSNELDLDIQSTTQLSVAGTGFDYGGGALAYMLTGTFDPTSQQLNGKINWGFEQSSEVREDVFLVNLAGADTGDVLMTQTQVTGCTAQIRFQRRI